MHEYRKITCPFCNRETIEALYTPRTKRKSLARCRTGSGSMIYTKEKYEVLSDCPNCGKSKKEIQRTLNQGTGKSLSHKEMLERLKKAGLPTKI